MNCRGRIECGVRAPNNLNGLFSKRAVDDDRRDDCVKDKFKDFIREIFRTSTVKK